jgi:transglutaminase-like putative cysteine protease
MWILALRLQITHWTDNLDRIELLMLIGLALGLILGLSRFSSRLVRWLAIVYTLFFIPMEIGLTMDSGIQWSERLSSMAGRLSITTALFFQNKPVQDPILFLVSMAVLIWSINILAGYQLTRYGSPWWPVIVAGVTLFIIDNYNPFITYRGLYTAIFVLMALLLLGRLSYLQSRRGWHDRGLAIDFDTGYYIGRTILVSGVVLVFFSWNIPFLVRVFSAGSAEQQELYQAWKKFQDHLSNAFVGLRGPAETSVDYYGEDLSLGRSAISGNETVFTVRSSAVQSAGMRYYWQGRTYDLYQDGQWQSTITGRQRMAASNWPPKYPDWKGRDIVDFSITLDSPLTRTIYVPAVPLSVSRPVDVILYNSQNGGDDVTSLDANPPLHAGETLQVKSWVSAPTAEQLRSTNQAYPSWVTQRYLQLPDNLPPRIRDLARQIVADSNNPYEKTVAITDYLRSHISYTETVPAVPFRREPLDWFLFDLKQGFCNYYASAEVILLRSVGIPARLAVGYAQGTPQTIKNNSGQNPGDVIFTVKRRDSHSWPEVYFVGEGWVEFEPTVSQPVREIPQNGAAGTDQNQSPEINNVPLDRRLLANPLANDQGNPLGSGSSTDNFWQTVAAIIGIPGLLAALFFIVRRWWKSHPEITNHPFPVILEYGFKSRGLRIPKLLFRWARHAELSPIEKIFLRIGWMLKLLGKKALPSQTPGEQTGDLIKALPITINPANVLLDEYQKAIYSRHSYDIERARQAQTRLWELVLKAWFKRLVGI